VRLPPADSLSGGFLSLKNTMSDKIKLIVAFLLVASGVTGYYLLAEHAAALRVISVLVGVLAGAVVASFSAVGGKFVAFSRESWAETKRVVWPTRKETIQTTGVVFLLVVVLAIFLWIVDASLMSLVKLLMGQGD
jgi:preprotein translocase subunit SecE